MWSPESAWLKKRPQPHCHENQPEEKAIKEQYAFQRAHFEKDNDARTGSKGEDFLKVLDRTAKACEYAVLVSLLEPDRELYNSDIVDVLHRYPKIYVVRSQNVDITKFETQLDEFKKPSNAFTKPSRTWKKSRKRYTSHRHWPLRKK